MLDTHDVLKIIVVYEIRLKLFFVFFKLHFFPIHLLIIFFANCIAV